MSGFNLSAIALKNRTLVLYFMLVCMLAGFLTFGKLGQKEDPEFTFRIMIMRTIWPGATPDEMQNQVLDKIERKLQETPYIKYVRSFAKPGESLSFIELRGDTPPKAVADVWYKVRRNIGDIRYTLPSGVQGPFFNDEFGDTFGSIYAFTGKGYTIEELRKFADRARQEILSVPSVKKVELIGIQPETIYVDLDSSKIATLGIDPQVIANVLNQQNSVQSAGFIESGMDHLNLRVTGSLTSVESVANSPITANGKTIRLSDIAKVHRGYQNPKTYGFQFEGQPGIALAVAMTEGGDVIKLGQSLKTTVDQLSAQLPLGVEIHQVSNQPLVVKNAVDEFLKSLAEAVAIVLIVSFISLGMREGIVVALSIPLVLAMTFIGMYIFNIDLQRISLGALIIALGLLVDDAIIAVEMMASKLEQGYDKIAAATYAYTATAFPMLTGTLITVAGFLPVGLAKSAAGEYTFSIFAVVGLALVISWLVAVIFTPYIGFKLLPESKKAHHADVYQKPFYQRFRKLLAWCLTYRKTVMLITLAAFVLSIAGFKYVPKQFFPSSNRLEVMVDLWLPEGSSQLATETQASQLQAQLKNNPHIENITAYIGQGSPRFYLPLNQELFSANYAQLMIMTKSLADREALLQQLNHLFETRMPSVRARAIRLENGPPVGYPVQFRVIGPDQQKVRRFAFQMADIMRANPNTRHVNLDINGQAKVIQVKVDQDKARAIGASTSEISRVLNLMLSGEALAQYREGDQSIAITARLNPAEVKDPATLENMPITTLSGKTVPLSQVATVSLGFEDGTIWRRNRMPEITVRADIADGLQAPDVSDEIEPKLRALEKTFPTGYRIELGGSKESSGESQDSIAAVMPLMLFVVVTLLMLQLRSFSRTFLVLLTAPLGLIGVTLVLLVFQQPFGFVANLGVIALAGMIMRNSVILVDQIEQDIKDGSTPWQAIIESTVRRFRPIMLTALAAILAMIPLTRSIFWGPMAFAIMGGLLVATVLTLLFLPALYAAWFRVKKPA
ncbi:efflux RND transporter permease subunit [Leeia sp. TBRC 13508]|uniref:Efflux RND transporter permease subunit n=1 Tax=Leeia speluncae TaxID=2884804 RepID=A0ABS8D3A5_9NEIS|nr:efflux RND transporter permease subunit [Leeia speluncae]MCB6182503.1 efflux RND transporter permease subunit [Leeia speluncae]